MGRNVTASLEEKKQYMNAAVEFSSDLPWSHAEEALSSSHVSMQDAENSLESEMQGVVDKKRLQEFKEALQATYVALPKNDHGRLEHQTVRYVLHRHFVQ